jgi:hypothetical protein
MLAKVPDGREMPRKIPFQEVVEAKEGNESGK